MDETADQVIERAICAAIGCTEISMRKAASASKQIRRFVTEELAASGFQVIRPAPGGDGKE